MLSMLLLLLLLLKHPSISRSHSLAHAQSIIAYNFPDLDYSDTRDDDDTDTDLDARRFYIPACMRYKFYDEHSNLFFFFLLLLLLLLLLFSCSPFFFLRLVYVKSMYSLPTPPSPPFPLPHSPITDATYQPPPPLLLRNESRRK